MIDLHEDFDDVFDIGHTDATDSLIGVRAGLLSPTLRALDNTGFIDAAKKGHIAFVLIPLLHSRSASVSSNAFSVSPTLPARPGRGGS